MVRTKRPYEKSAKATPKPRTGPEAAMSNNCVRFSKGVSVGVTAPKDPRLPLGTFSDGPSLTPLMPAHEQ